MNIGEEKRKKRREGGKSSCLQVLM